MEGQYYTEPVERESERERGKKRGFFSIEEVEALQDQCAFCLTYSYSHTYCSVMSLRNPSTVVRVTGTVSQD